MEEKKNVKIACEVLKGVFSGFMDDLNSRLIRKAWDLSSNYTLFV